MNNPNALGAAWAAEKIKVFPTADALLEAMKTTDFSSQALVLKTASNDIPLEYNEIPDHGKFIEEVPDRLVYQVSRIRSIYRFF